MAADRFVAGARIRLCGGPGQRARATARDGRGYPLSGQRLGRAGRNLRQPDAAQIGLHRLGQAELERALSKLAAR